MADAMHLTGKNSHSLTVSTGLIVDTCRVDIKTLKVFPEGFALHIQRIEEDDTGTVINLSPEETAELLVLLTKEVMVHNSSEEF